MITNGFNCIGVGEQAPQDVEHCRKSELLPAGWNASHDVAYNLLYQKDPNTDVYVLKVVQADQTLFVHVQRLGDEAIGSTPLLVSQYVNDDLESHHSAFKNLSELSKKFKTEVLDSFTKTQPSKEASTSTTRSETRQGETSRRRPPDEDDPLRVGPPRRPGMGYRDPEWGAPSNPFSVGTGDLDPLAAGRGGMLMDPRRGIPGFGGGVPDAGLPGRLPRGAVPPGARFDPFGPPDLDPSGNARGGHRAGPDPDHLPPPGYDDMFM